MIQKYQCTTCNYKFSPKKITPNRCPYCSKETLEQVKSAQEYINEILE